MKSLGRDLLVVLAVFAAGGWTLVQAKDDPWEPFHFLIGEWVGEGKEGQGTGHFSLAPDLGGKILVRRNHAELPAGNGRPAAVHEDLMVIYKSQDSKSAKAIYFDSEDHVINYTVTFPRTNRQALMFISTATARIANRSSASSPAKVTRVRRFR